MAGCIDYPEPGSLNPVQWLCAGDYDVNDARCTVPVDLGTGPAS